MVFKPFAEKFVFGHLTFQVYTCRNPQKGAWNGPDGASKLEVSGMPES
jgi:hypothetical protein